MKLKTKLTALMLAVTTAAAVPVIPIAAENPEANETAGTGNINMSASYVAAEDVPEEVMLASDEESSEKVWDTLSQ